MTALIHHYQLAPGVCFRCGTSRVPAVDYEMTRANTLPENAPKIMWDIYGGRIAICWACIREAAVLLGWMTPEDAELLREALGQETERADLAEAEVAALRDHLDAYQRLVKIAPANPPDTTANQEGTGDDGPPVEAMPENAAAASGEVPDQTIPADNEPEPVPASEPGTAGEDNSTAGASPAPRTTKTKVKK